ncbi:MAG: hypothetical protein IJ562_01290 [Prevotella sp.]|nr:hypothetical protein [Prevotella sp.]
MPSFKQTARLVKPPRAFIPRHGLPSLPCPYPPLSATANMLSFGLEKQFAKVFMPKTASFYRKSTQFSIQKVAVFNANTPSNSRSYFLKSENATISSALIPAIKDAVATEESAFFTFSQVFRTFSSPSIFIPFFFVSLHLIPANRRRSALLLISTKRVLRTAQAKA